MGFAAGSDVRVRPLKAAFTMVEVLLVIGMLVLIMGVAGLWMQRGMFAPTERPPQEAFLAAAAQARVLAMQQGQPVLLTFDGEAQGFRLKVLDTQTPGGLDAYDGALPWETDTRWRSGFSGGRSAMRGNAGDTNNLTAAAGGGSGIAGSVNNFTGSADRTKEGSGSAGSAPAGSVSQRAADTRFFALPQGSQLRVTFYLLYGDEPLALQQPLEGIRYHPSGVSTPVQVRMEDRGSPDFRLTLLPDSFSGGLRLDEGGQQ